MTRKITSLVAVAALLAAALTFLSTSATRAQASTAAKQCAVADVSVSFHRGSPGAGQRYATLTLKNTSKSTCGTGGFVGLGLLNKSGHKLPTDVVRTDTSAAKAIYLKPGQKASTQLHWGAIPSKGRGTGTCRKAPAEVAVTPPNSYKSLVHHWGMGIVCQSGRIDITPLTRG